MGDVVLDTVFEAPHKASALVMFPTIADACDAVTALASQPVAAVELMDRASLRSVEDKAGVPDDLRELPDAVAALLIETRAATTAELSATRRLGAHGDRPHRRPPTVRVHRRRSRVHRVLEHPQGPVPCGRRGAHDRHHRDHRGRHVPGVAARRRHARPAGAVRHPRVRRRGGLRARARGERPLRLHAGLRQRRRGRSLRPFHARPDRAGGRSIRRFAQGRARHGSQHGTVPPQAVGGGGGRPDA